MDSNFLRVKTWMGEVGQATPDRLTRYDRQTMALRKTLIKEEFNELMDLFDAMEHSTLDHTFFDEDTLILEVVKEMCDLLVVTYGALVALGVDGDAAFLAVMENNDGKIAHAQRREDGKTVVAPEVKENLKRKMRKNLTRLLNLEAA